ncbi:MAG: hypothetical protein D6820_10170 [Lentisphaerae bacterium]|nr:MAG: hypothetical protein D6820_10170 [Lentisphaerota bacterium]
MGAPSTSHKFCLKGGYLPLASGWAAVTVHEPEGAEAKGDVICLYPLGEERKAAYRFFMELANRLSGGGWRVLRIDYAGYGSNPHEHTELTFEHTSRLVHELATTWGKSENLCLVGLRWGADLALHCCSEYDLTCRLVLVEPVLKGSVYLEELRRRRDVQLALGRQSEMTKLPKNEMDGEDFFGFPFSACFCRELSEWDAIARLERLHEECEGLFLHLAARPALTGLWAQLAAIPLRGMTVAALRHRPVWGSAEYFDTTTIQEVIHEYIEFSPERFEAALTERGGVLASAD